MRISVPILLGRIRRGAANRAAIALLASVFALVALSLLLSRSGPGQASSNELTVYCAAGLRESMEAIRVAYEQERHVRLTIQYGGSSTLLANLRLHEDADVFLPADDSYIHAAMAEGLVASASSVAKMRPILAVRKADPLNIRPQRIDPHAIHTIDDVLTKNVSISMTDPSAAATGKLVQTALEKTGKWEEFKSHVTVFKGTVSEVAADMQVGAVDGGIIWDCMLKQLPGFIEAPLAELSPVTANVAVGVVFNSKHRRAAEEFEAFLSSPSGQKYFIDAGFLPGPPPR